MGRLSGSEWARTRLRAKTHTIKELCRAEDEANRQGNWWLAEQLRWSIAIRVIEGGEDVEG